MSYRGKIVEDAGILQHRHYGDLDGFRTVAALAIVAMHIHVRGEYVGSPFLNDIVAPLGTFVTLFFIISGFGMCCGYFERIRNNTIDLSIFYTRRIEKILPFFALLIGIDVVVNRFSCSSIWEAIADLSLVFNLMPDLDIQVIGVAWALGVIFLFYFLFPFFVFLLQNKRRAWLTFVTSFILSLSCIFHFLKTDGSLDDRRFIYQAVFFVSGGLLFLYKDRIASMGKIGRVATLIVSIAVLPLIYVQVPIWASNIKQLILWIPWMIFAITGDHKVFSNKIMRFISSISMEIYLSHLFIFQVVKVLGLSHLFPNDDLSYILTLILVLIGVVSFAFVSHICIDKVRHIIHSILSASTTGNSSQSCVKGNLS